MNLIVYFAGLAASIALRFWPLTAFLVAFGALVLYLRWRPDSRLVPVLAHWIGPYPYLGERQSHYLPRLSGFALVLFLLLAGGAVGGAYLFRHQLDGTGSHPLVAAVFLFGLPLLAGMAAFGGLGCVVKAAWLRLTGQGGFFRGPEEDGT